MSWKHSSVRYAVTPTRPPKNFVVWAWAYRSGRDSWWETKWGTEPGTYLKPPRSKNHCICAKFGGDCFLPVHTFHLCTCNKWEVPTGDLQLYLTGKWLNRHLHEPEYEISVQLPSHRTIIHSSFVEIQRPRFSNWELERWENIRIFLRATKTPRRANCLMLIANVQACLTLD
jgi:hypothetical protein